MARLLRAFDGVISNFWDPLDRGPLPDQPPACWHGLHVARRLREAFETLRLLPGGRLHQTWGHWPAYSYEWQDLIAQQEQEAEEKTRAEQQQNRARVNPTIEQISHMEAALYWPAEHLARQPKLLKATNALAFAYAIERDASWLAHKHGGVADTWRSRHDDGCAAIAVGLIADRVPVF